MSQLSIHSLEIFDYAKANRCLSNAAIGRHFKITRQRVKAILDAVNSQRRPVCQISTKSSVYGKKGICPRCGGRKLRNSEMCQQCYRDAHWVPLICAGCNILFYRRQCDVLRAVKMGYKNQYCMRECSAHNMGNNNRKAIGGKKNDHCDRSKLSAAAV